MTLTLTSDTESRLRTLAQRRGQAPEEVVDALIAREMTEPELLTQDPASSQPPQTDPTLALFAQWAIEDATDDPEEIARRQKEGDELMAALQANRFNLEGRTDFRALLGDEKEIEPMEEAA